MWSAFQLPLPHVALSSPALPPRRKTTFSAPEVTEKLSAMDFFVSQEGDVYEQEYTRDGTVYVAKFSSDGLFRARIQLDAEPFIPYQIVTLQTGNLLLSGTLANPGGRLHTPV